VFNDVVSSDLTTGYNLRTRAIAAGWNTSVPLIATITINAGVRVTSIGPAYTAFTTDIFGYPAGTTIALTNNGIIEGYGGTGGTGGSVSGSSFTAGTAGGTGGVAIQIFHAIQITNNGIIGGGGGGGGGGGAARNSLDAGKTYYGASGGGGGGGRANGTAGSAGTSAGNNTNGVASAGSAGTLSAPGSGGASYVIGSTINSGVGGIGGDLGQPGQPGGAPDQGYVNGGQSAVGAGGAAGHAISNGSYITWMAHGSILGSVDNWGVWGNAGSDFTTQMGGRFTQSLANSLHPAWTSGLAAPWYWNTTTASTNGATAAGNITASIMVDNTTGSPITAHLYGSVDNSLVSLTVNGVGVTPGTAMGYTITYQTNNFTLATGVNVVTVVLNNASPSVAGFNLRVRRTSDNAVLAGPNSWFI
jgi:hypothetical protein